MRHSVIIESYTPGVNWVMVSERAGPMAPTESMRAMAVSVTNLHIIVV